MKAEEEVGTRAHALWTACVALLLLMLFTGAYTTRELQRLEKLSATARRESRERSQLLVGLRTGIYHASTLLRDYLTENDNERAHAHGLELERVRAQFDRTLPEYQARLPERERGAFQGLCDEITAYGKTLAVPLAWTATERTRRSDAYLQTDVIPSRQQALDLVKQIQDLDESEGETVARELRTALTSLRGRIAIFSGVTILLGALIALLSARRIRTLERVSEARFQQVEQSRAQLSDLSGRLLNAQEEERRKLSRELHDQLGQTSSALVAELAHFEREEPEGGPRRERITSARRLAEENVKSIRDVSLLLRPSMLDDLGLLPALRWQVREVRRRSGLKVHLEAGEIAEDLSDPIRTCLYRVVQEALNNCVKHCGGTEVRVTLMQDGAGLSVAVRDNGYGFHPREDKGVGLLGL